MIDIRNSHEFMKLSSQFEAIIKTYLTENPNVSYATITEYIINNDGFDKYDKRIMCVLLGMYCYEVYHS